MKRKGWLLPVLIVLAMCITGCSGDKAMSEAPDPEREASSDSAKDQDSETSQPSAEMSGESERDEMEAAPDSEVLLAVCEDFFSAYAALDGSTAGSLLQSGSSIHFSNLHGALSRHVEAELGACAIDGDTATVDVSITNADIAAVIAALPSYIASQEEASEAMIDALGASDVPTAVFDVTLSLARCSGEWRIEMTPELSNALLGGYHTLVDSMAQTIVEEEASQ